MESVIGNLLLSAIKCICFQKIDKDKPSQMDKDTSFLMRCLRSVGHEAEEAVDFLKHQLTTRFNPTAALEIVAYRGYGNRLKYTLMGRVLTHREPLDSSLESRWNNLQQSYRRFETDEVPNVLVEAQVDGKTHRVKSDAEGYFTFTLDTPEIQNATSFTVTLDLPNRTSDYSTVEATVYIPSPNARFGVISDIDDTILQTNATSVLEMMKLTLLESSRTRLAFSGVGEFYRALQQRTNPIFYVSGSPWNLYEFLIDFMKLNKLVEGPLMLRDFGIDKSKFIAGPHVEHKMTQIRSILLTYPDLTFILIGDSGQDDPEIYAAIAKEFPDQILSCYIRDASDAARDRDVQAIISAFADLKIDMLLVPDTLAAAVHASANSWVSSESLTLIKQSIDADLVNAT